MKIYLKDEETCEQVCRENNITIGEFDRLFTVHCMVAEECKKIAEEKFTEWEDIKKYGIKLQKLFYERGYKYFDK